jgi:hypothetical protein
VIKHFSHGETMKSVLYPLMLLLLIVYMSPLMAQGPPRGRGLGGPERMERLEKFRQMRLVETLKLNDDEAARLLAKQSASQDRIRGYLKTRDELIDTLEDRIRRDEKPDVKKLSDRILDLNQKIFSERSQLEQDVRKLLTEQQFAQYLVFERRFGREVRDAMGKMAGPGRDRGETPSPPPGD